jgi:hypothetical protein
MLPYFQLNPKSSVTSTENAMADQGTQQVLAEGRITKPSLLPKSFESSIQGFQFIQPAPSSRSVN